MSERFFIGISMGFNSSACIMSEERGLIAAISQERLNGEKNTKEFPLKAIIECLKIADADTYVYSLEDMEIEGLAISHYQPITIGEIERYLPTDVRDKLASFSKDFSDFDVMGYIRFVVETFCNVRIKTMQRVDHHKAHANSAIVFHGVPRNPITAFVTCDGFGDGLSSKIKLINGETLSSNRLSGSIGLVYQFVTGALGYKEHQHEGKITGLAAFGEPLYLEVFNRLFDNTLFGIRMDNVSETMKDAVFFGGTYPYNSQIEDFDLFLLMKDKVYDMVNELLLCGAEPKDIAATVQAFAETQITKWITRTMERHFGPDVPLMDVYLAGGVFANVKINQRIHELGFVDNIYVAPCMGDEGTAVGAAYVTMVTTLGSITFERRDLFSGAHSALLGPKHDVSVTEVNDLLVQNDVSGVTISIVPNMDDRASKIAALLSMNKIVCLYQGRMEFGPRALCNRSILYPCHDPSVNQWLNDKLSRTEFMPFAPFCKEVHANDLFRGVRGAEQTAQYMTITFDCTEEFARDYPAACHIDNTARPQFVTPSTNPLAYKILTHYERMTEKKALINTSFNLHNNPIIESPEVAIKSWIKSGTDALVINNIIIIKHSREEK